MAAAGEREPLGGSGGDMAKPMVNEQVAHRWYTRPVLPCGWT
jgi:hypothetical protein